MKTNIEALREKLYRQQHNPDLKLPEHVRYLQDIIAELINEVESVQRKIDKIHKVLGE